MKITEEYIIEDTKHHSIVAGRAINQNEFRLTTGNHAGETRTKNECKIMEKLTHSNALAVIGMAWTNGL